MMLSQERIGRAEESTVLGVLTESSSALSLKIISLLTLILVQRPCSKCVRRRREDSCIDVRHKKSGRPRLRKDAHVRSGPIPPSHPSNVSPEPSGGVCSPGGVIRPLLLDGSYQTNQLFRGSEISDSNSCLAKQNEREPSPNAKRHNTPPPSMPDSLQPVAHLTMDLGFIKASAAFWDAVGLSNMTGRNLRDVVLPTEIEKVAQIQRYFNSQQKGREPNYMPSITSRGPHGVQKLGFTVEALRFPLYFHSLAFMGANGYARPAAIRAVLANEGSFCFLVLLLDIVPRQLRASHAQKAPGLQAGVPCKRPSPEKVFAQCAPSDPIQNHPSGGVRPADLVPYHYRGLKSYIEYDSNYVGRPYEAAMGRQPYGGHLHPATQEASAERSAPQLRQSSQPAPRQCPSEQTPHSGVRSGRVDIRDLINI